MKAQQELASRTTSSDGDDEQPEVALDEAAARVAVRRSLSQALPLPSYEYGPDMVIETITADVLEDEGLLSAPPEAMQERWGEAVADMYCSADRADLLDFFSALARRLGELADELEAQRRAAGDLEAEGLCALCERRMPLTLHHLIPRELHQRYKARRGMSALQLSAGVLVCRPCHSAVHRAEDNKALAEGYSTLEALRAHPAVAKFAAWARRQRVAAPDGGGSAARPLRYPR